MYLKVEVTKMDNGWVLEVEKRKERKERELIGGDVIKEVYTDWQEIKGRVQEQFKEAYDRMEEADSR